MENIQPLLILMVVIWGAGKIFRVFSLPIIFGELIGGIIVGPVGFNLIDPNSEIIKILAELGIFFLMLHTGLETDPKKLFSSSKKSILIALGGAIIPFLGGYFVARFFDQNIESSLFIGMGLSITAIAISARLFKEYKIQKTEVAHTTLGAAIVDDVLALILFSVVLTIAKEGVFDVNQILIMLAKTILFFVIILFIGHKTSKHIPKFLVNKGFTLTFIMALLLGLIAEEIGLHSIFGAFLAGLFIQEEIVDEKIFNKIEDRIYGLSYSFLGPIFFASLAFSLDFTAVFNAPWFLFSILIIATIGKVLGSGVMALVQKINWQNSLIIGISMNSRGAVELIIASIGLNQGIIDKDVFSILVLMAFFTTIVSIFSMKHLAKYAK